jgi:transaldolase
VGIDSVRRAVFFDRDGVLNEAIVREGIPRPPDSLAALKIAGGAPEAVRAVREAGYLAIGITNQPDVARGTAARESVEALNAAVARDVGLDALYACYHDDADGCDCRKPKPGLLLRAAREHGIDLTASAFVGDRLRDVQCARSAGCRAIFLDCGYAETLRARGKIDADAVVGSLAEAIPFLMLKIKVFADGADKAGMLEMYRNPLVKGFTTNPTLMRKAGVTNFEAFARDVLQAIPDRPVSFEVFSDDFAEMERQARRIASWGDNVYVKIPVTNTQGLSCGTLIRRLSSDGVKVNVTAIMTREQVKTVAAALVGGAPSCVSVFAGRIADSGRDPVPIVRDCLALIAGHRQIELIWASPREILNVVQADAAGAHIITVTNELLAKLGQLGKDLNAFSLETVRMFHRDAAAAGFSL